MLASSLPGLPGHLTSRTGSGPATLRPCAPWLDCSLDCSRPALDPPSRVEKTPRHINHLDRIFRLDTKARVVLVVRDGRDVAASLKQRGSPWADCMGRWVRPHASLAAVRAGLGRAVWARGVAPAPRGGASSCASPCQPGSTAEASCCCCAFGSPKQRGMPKLWRLQWRAACQHCGFWPDTLLYASSAGG